MESPRGPRVRTQALLTPATRDLLMERAARIEASPTSVLTRVLAEHLPLSAAPPPRGAAAELVRFRVPFAMHQLIALERARWGCSLGLIVETALQLSFGRVGDDLEDFRRPSGP